MGTEGVIGAVFVSVGVAIAVFNLVWKTSCGAPVTRHSCNVPFLITMTVGNF